MRHIQSEKLGHVRTRRPWFTRTELTSQLWKDLAKLDKRQEHGDSRWSPAQALRSPERTQRKQANLLLQPFEAAARRKQKGAIVLPNTPLQQVTSTASPVLGLGSLRLDITKDNPCIRTCHQPLQMLPRLREPGWGAMHIISFTIIWNKHTALTWRLQSGLKIARLNAPVRS